MHAVSTIALEPRNTLNILSTETLIDAEAAADRLRSWAAVMSVEHSGEPFIRFENEDWSIHVLAGEGVEGDPEAGVETEAIAAGSYVLVENVDFYGIDKVLDALDQFVLASNTSRTLGPLEFHSIAAGGFAVGTLAVPVKGDLSGLPTEIESVAAPALGLPDTEPEHPVTEFEEGDMPVRAPGVGAPLTAIAITSQVGSMGETVAYLAAAELGWRYCRDSIVQEAAASDPEVEVDDVERATRHRGRFERLLESLATTPMAPLDPTMAMTGADLYTMPVAPDDEARAAIEDTMMSFADAGSVVIAGHGAALILRDHPTTLGVFICAPDTVRMSRVSNEAMPFEEAERFVRDVDDERRAYFKSTYDADWRDALEYDLTINTGEMTPRAAAGVIAAVVRASQQAQ